jgi:DNA-binding NarL/FixJ family response regulator
LSKDKALPKDLTKREMELCVLVAEGYTNIKIADKLYISEGTVKNYMSSIYDKFDLHDRTQLAIFLKNLLE